MGKCWNSKVKCWKWTEFYVELIFQVRRIGIWELVYGPVLFLSITCVEGMMWCIGWFLFKYFEGFVDIIIHCDSNASLITMPVEVETAIQFSLPGKFHILEVNFP